MRRNPGVVIALVLAVVVALPVAAGERENVWVASADDADDKEQSWVSDDGREHTLHGHRTMFFGEGAEELNLADLADGETRIIGSGEKQVTVHRSGDEATIERINDDGKPGVDVTCNLTSDTCKVMTLPGDPEKVMIMVQKSRQCINGVGDCADATVDIDLAGAGAHGVVVRKMVKCDDAGECNEFEDVSHSGMPHDAKVRIKTIGAGHPADMRMMLHGDGVFIGDDKVTLACPEGDATLRVAIDEADEMFLCPKHSVAMEKHEHPGHEMLQRILIESAEEPHERHETDRN